MRIPLPTPVRRHPSRTLSASWPDPGAQRGFAHTNYQSVFTDYQAVVEESLDGAAVPPGRRYIVRRYFQLIRPRDQQ